MQDLDGRSVNTESPETIIEENEPVSETSSTNNTTTLHYSNSSVLPSRTSSIVSSRQSLLLPTPELTPILSILNKYSTSNNQLNNRKIPIQSHHKLFVSNLKTHHHLPCQ